MASRPSRGAPDYGPALAVLAGVLSKLAAEPGLGAERRALDPLYRAAEACLLAAAGGLDRGRDAFDRAVADLAKAGIESIGARVVLARAYRELGEQSAHLCSEALMQAAALDAERSPRESMTPALRRSARRLAVLLLAASACETAPRRLVQLAKSATRHVLVGASSLEPWQIHLQIIFRHPPWTASGDTATRVEPPVDPRSATHAILGDLLVRADDTPHALRAPTDEQFRRAIAMMRTLKIRPERPGGGWVTPFGAAKRFAQCFDCDTFPRKETEARPRPRGRSSAKNRAPK